MRNVSNAVKALPDSLAEGMNKVSDNMGRMSERLGQDIKQSILKVTPSQREGILTESTAVDFYFSLWKCFTLCLLFFFLSLSL